MSDEFPLVENEIDDHKVELNQWIDDITKRTIPSSKKGVTDRFVRDCQTLITDVEKDEKPSSADLCDYDDRKNSLEVQYHNITQDL